MKIRSITCFFDPRSGFASASLDRLGKMAQAAQELFSNAGYEVQTLRLSTVPFPNLYPADDIDSAVRLAQTLEEDAKERGFHYISIGPAVPAHVESYKLVVPILSATKDVFLSGLMTLARWGGQQTEISPNAVQACAEIIQQAAELEPDGFANLRFAALANVSPGGPFFPGSYHQGERPAFALAIECADLAVEAARRARTLADFRNILVSSIESHSVRLSSKANHMAQQYDMDFRGFDFSLAPYPEAWCSLGGALESLGLASLGQAGSLAAVAYLAASLDSGSWMRTGFNGLMMPVLEDATLAARADEGVLTVQDLLTYSAVCGTGLDTVPLPGDVTAQQIYAVLMDVSALSLRLNKPLTARLIPIPGKAAGDPTGFDFAYFANSRVMALNAAPLKGLLTGTDDFAIPSRR
jgi:uncharacterized protein